LVTQGFRAHSRGKIKTKNIATVFRTQTFGDTFFQAKIKIF